MFLVSFQAQEEIEAQRLQARENGKSDSQFLPKNEQRKDMGYWIKWSLSWQTVKESVEGKDTSWGRCSGRWL